jgi:hypothetical protein
VSTRIPFLDELKADLLAHAPDDLAFAPVPSGPRPRRRGPVVAVAAFAAVVVVGSVLVWLTPGGEAPAGDDPGGWHIRVQLSGLADSTRPLSDLEAMPGVVGVRRSSDDPGETLFVVVDRPDRVDEVANEVSRWPEVVEVGYSEEVAGLLAEAFFARAEEGATVLATDPAVIQPVPGPEPRFDTSGLGARIDLEPAQPGDVDGLHERFPGRPPLDGEPRGPSDRLAQRHPSRPILHLGRHVGSEARLVLFPTTGDGYWISVLDALGYGASGGFLHSVSFGVVAGMTNTPGDGHMVVAVPEHTSVVMLDPEGHDPMWQRPILGWALFPIRGSADVPAVVEAFDADGALIGRWEDWDG